MADRPKRNYDKNPRDFNTIFIGILFPGVTLEILRNACEKYGQIVRVNIVRENAFCTYKEQWMARNALYGLRNDNLGRKIDYAFDKFKKIESSRPAIEPGKIESLNTICNRLIRSSKCKCKNRSKYGYSRTYKFTDVTIITEICPLCSERVISTNTAFY